MSAPLSFTSLHYLLLCLVFSLDGRRAGWNGPFDIWAMGAARVSSTDFLAHWSLGLRKRCSCPVVTPIKDRIDFRWRKRLRKGRPHCAPQKYSRPPKFLIDVFTKFLPFTHLDWERRRLLKYPADETERLRDQKRLEDTRLENTRLEDTRLVFRSLGTDPGQKFYQTLCWSREARVY